MAVNFYVITIVFIQTIEGGKPDIVFAVLQYMINGALRKFLLKGNNVEFYQVIMGKS